MTASAPAIRTHFVRLALKRLRAIPDGKGAVIRSRIEDALPQIREADPAGWLALDLALTVCNTIVDVLGEEAARQFWTQLIFDSYDRGILKPLISQAREAPRTGGGPIALLKLAPMAWQLAARDCGTIELIDDKDGGLSLSSASLAPEIARSRGFHCIFYGACQAMLDQFRAPGTVEVRREPGMVDRLIYDIRVR
ncbi:MAG: hypothetical protein KC636_07285 [Myxococcales bacterium]|nr:hypothetical protein [Myxococcales bacterium]